MPLLPRILAAAFLIIAVLLSRASAEEPINFFAAAGSATAVTEIAALFESRSGTKVRPVFASSAVLAQQIASGAPAALYLSAGVEWMDLLEGKGLLTPGSRRETLGNRLVLIARRGAEPTLAIGPDFPLLAALGPGRLAMGDPAHVPAGIYARRALIALHVWEEVKDRTARMAHVRAALAAVERGEAPLGIVYASDAKISDKVSVAGIFPEDASGPIVFSLALIGPNPTAEAWAFYRFLQSDEAMAIFLRQGFTAKERPAAK